MTWPEKNHSAANAGGNSTANDAASVKTAVTDNSIAEASAAGVIDAGKPTAVAKRGTSHGNRVGRAGRRHVPAPGDGDALIRTVAGHAYRRVNQGRAIIEAQDDEGFLGFLVMVPTGDICHATTRAHALQICRSWAKRNLRVENAVGILRIEWRERTTVK